MSRRSLRMMRRLAAQNGTRDTVQLNRGSHAEDSKGDSGYLFLTISLSCCVSFLLAAVTRELIKRVGPSISGWCERLRCAEARRLMDRSGQAGRSPSNLYLPMNPSSFLSRLIFMTSRTCQLSTICPLHHKLCLKPTYKSLLLL